MQGVKMFDRERTPISVSIGMVYTPQAFLQAPDAEIISSGKNSRSCQSVAIGRHGNFLGWGFAVDPSHMTPNARAMLVNSVAYISKFDGQSPIFKVPQGAFIPTANRSSPRDDLYDRPYYLSNFSESYDDNATTVEKQRKFIERVLRIKEERSLTQYEQLYFAMAERIVDSSAKDTETKAEYIERRFKSAVGRELYGKFGQAIEKYKAHYKSYAPTVYYDTSKYDFVVDQDALKLGVPVGDVRLIAKAIEMLEKDAKDKVAKRLLRRYTNQRFKTAANWRGWFDENKNRMFFHEVAGYKFYVDSRNDSLRSQSNPLPKKQMARQFVNNLPNKTSNQHPVLVKCRVEPEAAAPGQTVEVTVELEIHPGWHIYAVGDSHGVYLETQVNLELPDKTGFVSDWQKSDSLAGEKATRVYETRAKWKRKIKIPERETGRLTVPVTVSYMACNASICLPTREFVDQIHIQVQ